MKTIIRLTCLIMLFGTGINEVWGTAASLPFSYDKGSGDIASTDGISQSGLGSDYGSSPKMKFDGAGDFVLIELAAAPNKLGYNIKGNASGTNPAEGRFYVLESADGIKFTIVKNYSSISNTTTTEEFQLKRSTRYVKFIYDQKESGNVALGAISISALSSSAFKVSFSGGTTSFTDRTEASVGAGITLPTATTNATAGGWKFWGWSTAAVSTKTTTVPTTFVGRGGDTYYPETNNTTLYAVFAKGEFTKITSLDDLVADKKYLFVQKNGVNNYVMSNHSYYIAGDFRIPGVVVSEFASGKYHSADIANWQYTIEGSANEYLIRDVYNSSDENYLDIAYNVMIGLEQEDGDEYTINVSGGEWKIRNNYEDDGDYPYLTFETTNNTFYTTWESATVLLYKETQTSYYWGSPTVVTLSEGTINHATILIDPEYVATDSETPADRQVTIMVEPASGYDLAPAKRMTFTQTSATAVATYVSGPTDNGDGTYNYVYQFAQGNNGAGTFGITAGQLSFYRTACYREFDDGEGDGLWSTEENWTGNRLPTIQERADILKPVTVDITDATAKSVVLKKNSGNTGSLEIAPGKELVVATTVRKTTDGSTLVATGVNDINISSTSSDGLGALVMGEHDGTNKATVNFYTKSTGKKEQSTSVAQYVGTPFNDENNILYNWYNSWMYRIKYTSNVIGWERVNENEKMNPFEGYCVFSADAWDNDAGHSYWMQGTLVTSANHMCAGLNWQSGSGAANPNNENLLANSWMAPIKISAFEVGDFSDADATIYIFNAGSLEDWKTAGGDEDEHQDPTPASGDDTPAPGQYSSYSIKTTKYTGDAVIPAMQSFSVFTNDDDDARLTLNYNRLVYLPAVAGDADPVPNRAPRRTMEDNEPELMRLFVSAESGCRDKLLMLEREDFNESFDNGWDGRKMFGESFAPQLYAVTSDGNMAINCVPDWEGTVLGFRAGTEDNMYTFSFEYEGEGTWYLNDLKAEQSTRILSGNTYAFSTADSDMEARFIISATPIRFVPTAVENGEAEATIVRKLLINDHVYIIRHGRMYDATGVMVR